MRQIRLYTAQSIRVGHDLQLDGGPAHHLLKVLRARPGLELSLFNGDGMDYRARFVAAARDAAHMEVHAVRPNGSESPLRVTLAQGICRGEKMDWVLQKAVELGVHAFQPVITERTEVHLAGDRSDKRMLHWRGVIIGACEQSGRSYLPYMAAPVSLEHWLAQPRTGAWLVLDPNAPTRLSGLTPFQDGGILVGPEGGLSEREVELCQRCGLQGLQLGPRVLRSETAGPAALAALQSRFGDWQ